MTNAVDRYQYWQARDQLTATSSISYEDFVPARHYTRAICDCKDLRTPSEVLAWLRTRRDGHADRCEVCHAGYAFDAVLDERIRAQMLEAAGVDDRTLFHARPTGAPRGEHDAMAFIVHTRRVHRVTTHTPIELVFALFAALGANTFIAVDARQQMRALRREMHLR